MRRFFVFSKILKPALFTCTLIAHFSNYIDNKAFAKNAGRLKSFIIDRPFRNENIIPTTVQIIAEDVSTIASKT
ncbi:hypothetical protein HMPREF2557_07350 [Neisseria sp. HMSC064F03]|nr:hypothetical protein HMPREF2675_02530 [Neisseria sp. HMSC061H08]OHQ13740.1 hypothetical protein HMPREF2557_07350 [Neisseria sp. HMSC064F03]